MPLSIQELTRQLIGTGLAKPAQIEDAMQEYPGDIGDFLRAMERKQYLTSYQSKRIRKGEISELTIGRYKLLYRNAAGSFARVFRAESMTDGRMYALKLLRNRWAKDPDYVKSFHREANLCKRFDHVNIVPIYEVGEEFGRYYFTMEFIEGGNLREFMNVRKKLSAVEGARCMIDICSGLDYALGLGLTHRDLKMTNVLMSSKGVAKLVDFGLAGDDATQGKIDTLDARALEYATLEKSTNAPRGDARSDIFFAGAILYELIGGKAAWQGTRDREERRQFSRYSNVQPLERLDSSLPASMIDIVRRMMDVSPNSRYQTQGEVVKDLRAAAKDMGGPTDRNLAGRTKKKAKKPADKKTTVLCVEGRPKIQAAIREYFGERGYRVLLIGDYERARTRLHSENKPDCLVIMGANLNGTMREVAEELRHIESSTKVPALMVLSQQRADELEEAGIILDQRRMLVQPVNLKRLRMTIDKAIQRRDKKAANE